MKIIIHHNEWTKDPAVLRVLQLYSDYTSIVLPLLSRQYKFPLPDILNIKTFHTYHDIVNYAGRCRRTTKEGYSLLFNPEYCPRCGDNNPWVLEHELAHLATILWEDDWSHGLRFSKAEKEVREIVRATILPLGPQIFDTHEIAIGKSDPMTSK